MSIAFFKKTAEQVARTVSAARSSFTLESVGEHCFIEPGLPAEHILKITWRVILYDKIGFGLKNLLFLLFGHVSVSFRSSMVVYDTFHPVSAEGLKRLRRRRLLFGFLGFFTCIPMLIGMVMFLGACTSAIFSLQASASSKDRLLTLVLFLLSIWLLVGAAYFLGAMERKRLPASLKEIGRWPVRLFKIAKLPLAKPTS
jgi:hypothetical protein